MKRKKDKTKNEKMEVRTRIRLKVVLGYLFLSVTIFLSLKIASKAYNKLVDSVITLSKPDLEFVQIGRVLTNLSEAENKIRMYSLTQKERYLVMYADRINDIQVDLDSLRAGLADSSASAHLIDSMSCLLEDRAENLNRFVGLKKNKSSNNLSRRAIQTLNKTVNKKNAKIKTTKTTTTYLDTVVTLVPKEKKKKKKKKKRGLLARIFSGKDTEEEKDSLKTVLQKTKVTINTDTSYVRQPDSVLNSVKYLLKEAQRVEARNKAIVGREELRLVEGNTLIWSKIKKLLDRLGAERMQQLQTESDYAIEMANSSISNILLIVFVAILVVIILVIYTLSDIRKSNYYRMQLLVAKKNAEDLAKVKEEFLATMSHEIRTPLNAIIGFTNQLRKTSLVAKQKKFVGILKSSSEHLLGLVNDILDLSKIEAGKLKIESVGFNPSLLIAEVFELLKVNADDKKLDFIYNFDGDEAILLRSDSFRIKQILLNLGSNAIKFTNSGSVTIDTRLSTLNDKYKLVVDVIDTGIGIAEADIENVFKDFTQADTFSIRKYGGTGLGLTISSKLAKLLGGEITVESELGKGSCFTFAIILSEAELTEVQDMNHQVLAGWEQFAEKKFLIADDDEYSLMLIETIFKSWNFNAVFVADGALAYEKLQGEVFDMVITDINMPNMGGIELCNLIRTGKTQLPTDVPVIALTANVRESDIEKYLNLGMTDCLVKPFAELVLQTKIAACFSQELELVYTDKEEEVIADLLFDISEIRKFTADDPELEKEILVQFQVSANENIANMKKAASGGDFKEVGSIAHRMLSSFSQLKVDSVVPYLKELEDLLHKKSEIEESVDEIERRVVQVEAVITPVLDEIETEIKLLVTE